MNFIESEKLLKKYWNNWTMLLICDAKIKQLQNCVASVEIRKPQEYKESRNRTSEDLIVGREEDGNVIYRKDNR